MLWGVEAGAGCSVHRLLVIAHLIAPKEHGVLRHNNQLGQKGKGGRTGELFFLFYFPGPPTTAGLNVQYEPTKNQF